METTINALQPWMFSASMKEWEGAKFIRLEVRNGEPLKSHHGRPHIDLVTEVSSALLIAKKINCEPEKLYQLGVESLRKLGWRLPVPIGPQSLLKILTFADFPTQKSFESFCPEYLSSGNYRKDFSLFWKNRLQPKDFESLFKWVLRVHAAVKRKSQQDAAAYARLSVARFEKDFELLTAFYMFNTGIPESVAKTLHSLKLLSQSYIPISKRDAKKMQKSLSS